MKIVIFTSNALRHKFLANTIADFGEDVLVVSECRENDQENKSYGENQEIIEHFNMRYDTERSFFEGNEEFKTKCIPILYKEVNNEWIYKKIKSFDPDAMIVFGSSKPSSTLIKRLKTSKGDPVELALSLSCLSIPCGTSNRCFFSL